MAIVAVLPAMNGEKTLHPFFRKANGAHDTTVASSGDDTDRTNGFDGAQDESRSERKPGKKRKSKDGAINNGNIIHYSNLRLFRSILNNLN